MTVMTYSRNFENLPAADPALEKDWEDLNTDPTFDGRKAAFTKMQERVYEEGYALPFGRLSSVQAVRSDVKNFRPFRIPRMSNVWLDK